MRKQNAWSLLLIAALALGFSFAQEASQQQAAVKEHHLKVSQNEKNCGTCHAASAPEIPPDTACLKCHGSYEKVAQRTAALEHNPHDSPHYGNTATCTACHSEHGRSRAICSDCHLFKYEM